MAFGIGAFNLVRSTSCLLLFINDYMMYYIKQIFSVVCHSLFQTLSLFPARILKVLEFAGFSGDKVTNLFVLVSSNM